MYCIYQQSNITDLGDEDHKIMSDRYFRIVTSCLTNREKNLFRKDFFYL